MPEKFDLIIGACFGALGACMRTYLDVNMGVKVNPWLAVADVALSATMGVLAFGVTRELAVLCTDYGAGDVWWTCAAVSGVAGSVGPQLVRYVSIILRRRLNITPADLREEEEQ